jgi:hypothetical protein
MHKGVAASNCLSAHYNSRTNEWIFINFRNDLHYNLPNWFTFCSYKSTITPTLQKAQIKLYGFWQKHYHKSVDMILLTLKPAIRPHQHNLFPCFNIDLPQYCSLPSKLAMTPLTSPITSWFQEPTINWSHIDEMYLKTSVQQQYFKPSPTDTCTKYGPFLRRF